MLARSLIVAVCGLTLVVAGATAFFGTHSVKAESAASGTTTSVPGGTSSNLAAGSSPASNAGAQTAGNTASGCKQGYVRSNSTGKCVRARRGSTSGSH
ncbi:MAG: hypothetical protein GC150_03545 [Rhizobiales bacterium]|nr:hypothetical protein [Hyphomicrobiales bacterium]